MSCSICLKDILDGPVSIPCGHVYCMKCLSRHVNTRSDSDDSDDESNDSNTQSTCPTCRASFSIVNPELTYLPKKYHRYVLSSVRRLYLDTSKQEKWQEDIQELEQMNSRLRKKIERLRCENSLLASERDITIEAYNGQIESNSQQRHAVDKLKRELVCAKKDLGGAKEAQNELEAIKKDYRYLEKKYDKLKDHVRHLESSTQTSMSTTAMEVSVGSIDEAVAICSDTANTQCPRVLKSAPQPVSFKRKATVEVNGTMRPTVVLPKRARLGHRL